MLRTFQRLLPLLVMALAVACNGQDESATNTSLSGSDPADPGAGVSEVRSPLIASCGSTPGQWVGCGAQGCSVCAENTKDYPYYFANHPLCDRSLSCNGSFTTCNANCPAPSEADKAPAAAVCQGTTGQWAGCRGTGCSVCQDKLTAYPYYFLHHPRCAAAQCDGQSFACNADCPAPSDLEMSPPSGTCSGSPSGWQGCRGNGCAACTDLLNDYPLYFQHNPLCVPNTACAGVHGTCNSNCPAPSAADKAPITLPDPFAKPTAAFCPSGGEVAIAADSTWETYLDGVRLKPADTGNTENNWRKPAKYPVSLSAGLHVIAVKATDSNGGNSGFLANFNMSGYPYAGGLTDKRTAWQVLQTGKTPPTNWLTDPTLVWSKPPVAATACVNGWATDATFKANWAATAPNLSGSAWLWNANCVANQFGWQTNNWYRLVVNVRCDAGATSCIEGQACPHKDSSGNPDDVWICRNGSCQAPVSGCEDLTGSVDSAGNFLAPAGVSALIESVDPGQQVDQQVGQVATGTDGEESLGQCAPSIGDVPADIQNQVVAADNTANTPLTDFGVNLTPAQAAQVLSRAQDPSTATGMALQQLATILTPQWSQGIAAASLPAYVEPASCDDKRDPASPFAGRDIIFVHGFNPDVVLGKVAGSTAASRTWPADREDFYSGTFKAQADEYWSEHIGRYLAGKNNRYMTVAWSSAQRLDVAADAMLTQVNDAMRTGRGVVYQGSDLREQRAFCVPNCIVISHSTGAPIADVALAVASATPSLKFIPDHVKVHVAFEGAFGGSPLATMAMLGSSAVQTPGLLADSNMCRLFMASIGASTAPCALPLDLTNTVLVDLVPAVMQSLWGGRLAQNPVPTLTSTGGHGLAFAPGLKILFPGFDDSTLISNSTCANPNPSWFAGPSGYIAWNPLNVYDMGIPIVRGIGYFLDQKIDPLLGTSAAIPGFTSGGCVADLSPTGMVQPVSMHLGGLWDPTNRIDNHFSLLQTAAAHAIGGINSFSGRDYLADGARHFEEVRVITDGSVYTRKGNDLRSAAGTDPGVLVSPAMKNMVYERVKGWSFTVHFRIPGIGRRFNKTFWIWKRRYHNLQNQDAMDQGDYIYQNVATTGPALPAYNGVCSNLVSIRVDGPSTAQGSVDTGFFWSVSYPGGSTGGYDHCTASGGYGTLHQGCTKEVPKKYTNGYVNCSGVWNSNAQPQRIDVQYKGGPTQSYSCVNQTCTQSVPINNGFQAVCVF